LACLIPVKAQFLFHQVAILNQSHWLLIGLERGHTSAGEGVELLEAVIHLQTQIDANIMPQNDVAHLKAVLPVRVSIVHHNESFAQEEIAFAIDVLMDDNVRPNGDGFGRG